MTKSFQIYKEHANDGYDDDYVGVDDFDGVVDGENR